MQKEIDENEEILAIDGEPEEEIEIVNTGGNNKEDDEFDFIVGTLQEIVIEDEFMKLQTSFFREKCEVFENTEENKIVYMEIFKAYQSVIEEHLTHELIKRIQGFEMKRFLELLPNREKEIDEELMDLLLSFTDFMRFKDIMLDEKKKLDQERKRREETLKKKPQKPLKQASSNNTNIFSIDKKDFLKEEQKFDHSSSKIDKNKTKPNENKGGSKKEIVLKEESFGELSLDIISLTPQIIKKKAQQKDK